MKKTLSQIKGKRFVVSGTDPDSCVTTTNWLLDHGARVTVVGGDNLSGVEKRIEEHLKRTALDGKSYEEIRDRISWTPESVASPTDLHKLFLSVWKKKVIGISGMHGKTTTAVWAGHLIGDAVVAGHMPERPLLPSLDSRARLAIIKIPSASLAATKITIVNTDQQSNLDAAIHAAHLAGVSKAQIQRRITTLPQVPMRQEIVYQTPKLTIVNDAMATEPARGLYALHRWGGPTCVLICGGTDRDLDYREWAQELPKYVRATNTILLTGSATRKMRTALGEHSRGIRAYDSLDAAFKAARKRAGLYVSSVVLFSPAAKSFEQFANEFDRGQQFNALVQRNLKRR